MFITTWATTRENPITRTLELTLPDKRGVGNDDDDDVGNQICWNNARFFEYTGTNAFSRIQKVPILQDRFRAKTRRFPIRFSGSSSSFQFVYSQPIRIEAEKGRTLN